MYEFKKQYRFHIDEKWFYTQELKQKRRHLPCEGRPKEPTAQHKSHVSKIMLSCGFGRPELIDGVWFDGKLTCYPFIEYKAAVNNTKKRKAGTL